MTILNYYINDDDDEEKQNKNQETNINPKELRNKKKFVKNIIFIQMFCVHARSILGR